MYAKITKIPNTANYKGRVLQAARKLNGHITLDYNKRVLSAKSLLNNKKIIKIFEKKLLNKKL